MGRCRHRLLQQFQEMSKVADVNPEQGDPVAQGDSDAQEDPAAQEDPDAQEDSDAQDDPVGNRRGDPGKGDQGQVTRG